MIISIILQRNINETVIILTINMKNNFPVWWFSLHINYSLLFILCFFWFVFLLYHPYFDIYFLFPFLPLYSHSHFESDFISCFSNRQFYEWNSFVVVVFLILLHYSQFLKILHFVIYLKLLHFVHTTDSECSMLSRLRFLREKKWRNKKRFIWHFFSIAIMFSSVNWYYVFCIVIWRQLLRIN